MKTILIPTDFSESAQNAAYYALHLAKVLKANLTLCHAFIVPSEVATEYVDWPLYEYSEIKDSTVKQLSLFADKLKVQFKHDADTKLSPLPEIYCESEVGTVSDMIDKLIKDPKQTMIVLGMVGMNAVIRFIFGSTSSHLINHARVPILLIPSKTKFVSIKRIAFATDFNNDDIEVIRSLAGFAGRYDAELVITNVKDEWEDNKEHQQKERLFLCKLIAEIDYSQLLIKHIASVDIDDGLELLSSKHQIDMMVMVHKKVSVLDHLLKGSHSQTLAKHIKIPLMVIPENLHPIF